MPATNATVIRDDLSSKLVHLTKGTAEEAAQTFRAILKDKCLKAFPNGTVTPKDGVICFSEAPMSKLGQLIASAHSGFPYQYFGVMVDKSWLFGKGARPVIYQPEAECALLDPKIRYRHKVYDPLDSAVPDYTFEREWRIPVNELPLDPAAMTLVVPTRKWSHRAREGRRAQVQRSMLITRGMGGSTMTEDRWFFLVLEDLGIPITGAPEPPDDWILPTDIPSHSAP